MAIYGPWLNPQVILNSVDLSNRIDQATLDLTYAAVETTTFGQTAKTYAGGLGDHKLTLEFMQDFAVAEVDATLSPIVGTLVPFNIKPTNSATSSVNPAYTGTVLITEYKPMDGKVGDALKLSATWNISGAVTRATS